MKGIRDRVALITGGASGIGAGLVQAFAAAGAKVAFADIQDEQGQKLQQQIGSQCLFVSGDLRRDADIDQIVDTTASTFGGIDFLINAAATYADKGADSDRAMWQNGFDTNLFGHVMLARRAHEHLKRSAMAVDHLFHQRERARRTDRPLDLSRNQGGDRAGNAKPGA